MKDYPNSLHIKLKRRIWSMIAIKTTIALPGVLSTFGRVVDDFVILYAGVAV
jgi:hypothetical protein